MHKDIRHFSTRNDLQKKESDETLEIQLTASTCYQKLKVSSEN